MFRKIVSFGDSFAWGDELLGPNQKQSADDSNRPYREQNCYTGILAKHYGVPFENLAFPGGSCQSTRWIYTWWRNIEHDPGSCLVLIQMSSSWRSSQYDQHRIHSEPDMAWNRFVHSAWIDYYKANNKLVYDYFMLENHLANCDDRNKLVQAETYLFFQGQMVDCAGMLMFHAYAEQLDHKIKPKSLLWPGHGLNWLLPDADLWALGGHLNEVGHERLATLLIQEIDKLF